MVDSDPHAPELQPRDFQVECRGDGINPRLQPGGVLREIAGGYRLDCEAHVHDFDRMALAGCDVHEAAFGDEVGPLASRERVFVDELADSPLALRGFRQIGFRDFVVEMARVREDDAVLHRREMRGRHDVLATRRGDDEIRLSNGAAHGEDFESVHRSFDCFHRIEASMDGFEVLPMRSAVREADFIVSATGCKDIVTAAHFPAMKDGVVLANAGHFDNEISKADLQKAAKATRRVREFVDEYALPGG